MTIVVGYTPTPAGRAALLAAAVEAAHRPQSVVVVNSSRGDALSDPGYAQQADLDWAAATLDEAGVSFTIRQQCPPDPDGRTLPGPGRQGGVP